MRPCEPLTRKGSRRQMRAYQSRYQSPSTSLTDRPSSDEIASLDFRRIVCFASPFHYSLLFQSCLNTPLSALPISLQTSSRSNELDNWRLYSPSFEIRKLIVETLSSTPIGFVGSSSRKVSVFPLSLPIEMRTESKVSSSFTGLNHLPVVDKCE